MLINFILADLDIVTFKYAKNEWAGLKHFHDKKNLKRTIAYETQMANLFQATNDYICMDGKYAKIGRYCMICQQNVHTHAHVTSNSTSAFIYKLFHRRFSSVVGTHTVAYSQPSTCIHGSGSLNDSFWQY